MWSGVCSIPSARVSAATPTISAFGDQLPLNSFQLRLPADRTLVLEVVARHRLAQDHDRRRRRSVAGEEAAAGDEPRADRFEVAGADDAGDRFRGGGDRLEIGAVDLEFLQLRKRSGQRRRRGHRRRLHRRLRRCTRSSTSRENCMPPLAVERGEVRRLQAEHVGEIEARIDRVELQQAAGQQPGADQQHEGRGELAHDQCPLRASAARRCRSRGRRRWPSRAPDR